MKRPSSLYKKAQVSPVFKYIFVLVVGAIILIFFIRFAMKAETTGKEVIKAEVLHALDASIQAFSVSEHSSGVIPSSPMPTMIHMKFGTGPNCGKFTIIGQKYFVPIERVLFGPSEMKMKQLNAWTFAWNFPFKVLNAFYIMNSRSKYYLMYDESSEEEIEFVRSISSYPPSTMAAEMEHLPKRFDIKYLSKETEPNAQKKLLDMVKVNYFSPINGVSTGLKGSYLKVSPDCENPKEQGYNCFGTVEFFDGANPTGKSTFIGRSMMFGAIMADSYEEYECQYGLALSELERFIKIYQTKAEKLSVKKQYCTNKYITVKNLMDTMLEDIAVLRTSNNYEAAAKVSSDANTLKEFNEDELAGDGNCVHLF